MAEQVTQPPPTSQQTTETKTTPEVRNKDITPEAWQQIALERMDKLTTYRTKAEQLESELNKYRAAEQERQAKDAQRQQDQEKQKLEGEGKYQEALKLEHESHTKAMNNVLTTAQQKIIPSLIKGQLANSAIVPTAVDDVSNYLKSRIGLDDKFDPYVKGDDGKPLLDEKTMQPVPVDQFIASYIENRPWLKGDKMVIGTKTQPGAKGSINSNPTWTPENALKSRALAEEWKAADPQGYEKAMDQYQRDMMFGKKKK
jgi:hypothetical protein